MGQQPSAEGQNKGAEVPYTKYSTPKKSTTESERREDSMMPKQGITVVNPDPDSNWKATRAVELQKLERVHRFWPILKSSLESIPPQEKIVDGIGYKNVLDMCLRFQLHLGESAKIVSSEQQALASRLRDIEMFSAGIAQQIIKREDKLQRTGLHLQKVDEVEKVLDNIHMALAHCIPLAQSLNNMLPEKDRLETFTLLDQGGRRGGGRREMGGWRQEDGEFEADDARADLKGEVQDGRSGGVEDWRARVSPDRVRMNEGVERRGTESSTDTGDSFGTRDSNVRGESGGTDTMDSFDGEGAGAASMDDGEGRKAGTEHNLPQREGQGVEESKEEKIEGTRRGRDREGGMEEDRGRTEVAGEEHNLPQGEGKDTGGEGKEEELEGTGRGQDPVEEREEDREVNSKGRRGVEGDLEKAVEGQESSRGGEEERESKKT